MSPSLIRVLLLLIVIASLGLTLFHTLDTINGFGTVTSTLPQPVGHTSASLSLCARSDKCISSESAYHSFEKKGGYQGAQDANPGRFLVDYAVASPSPDKIFVSIGCSKGNDLIEVLSLWDHTFWNTSRYAELWNQMNSLQISQNPKLANLASNLPHPAQSSSRSITSPVGVCVEPNLAGIQAIQKISDAMGFSKPHGGWERPFWLINAAVSDTSNHFMEFPVEKAGAWWSDIDWYNGKSKWNRLGVLFGIGFRSHKVPVKTADELLLVDHNVSGHDLMIFIDVNGYDALVLFGMANTLATGRVQYIEFEYDPRGDWKTRKLSEVILFLDSFQFDCFWLMKSGLHRLTGCWDARYDRPANTWVNVACVNRKDERWRPIMSKWIMD